MVLIADPHLKGCSVGAGAHRRHGGKVNAQDADIILVAGDIFDNTVEGIDDPEAVKASLRAMKSRLGVYACVGNPRRIRAPVQRVQHQAVGNTLRGEEMEQFVRESGMRCWRTRCG